MPSPTLVPPPTNTPEPTATPTVEPTPGPIIGEAPLSTGGPDIQAARRELDQPGIPVIGDAVPRVRNALGGIASSPRRRTTLIVIQVIASIFAAGIFARLILRKE